MADFKWKLSRPGVELEFETGSVKEAIGLLQEEGSQIQEIFGWTPGANTTAAAAAPEAPSGDKPKRTYNRKPAVEAVAPDPIPVPVALPPALPAPAIPAVITMAPTAAALPVPSPIAPELAKQNDEALATGGIPPYLAAPPIAPLPTVASPPPVGVLGPKVVKALDVLREGKPDGGQALADWLANCGLTIKGKSYDDACRALLMIADEKLAGIAGALGVA